MLCVFLVCVLPLFLAGIALAFPAVLALIGSVIASAPLLLKKWPKWMKLLSIVAGVIVVGLAVGLAVLILFTPTDTKIDLFFTFLRALFPKVNQAIGDCMQNAF